MKRTTLIHFAAMVLMVSCQSNEIANSKDVNPDTIYSSYFINYTEGDETVSCEATFRFGGSKGTTLVLNSPTKIQLDGQTLKVDSSLFSGAYYRIQKPVSSFTGSHEWAFINANNSILTHRFIFKPWKLINAIPSMIYKTGIVLIFNGLEDTNKVNIQISDTSAQTQDINREFDLQKGQAIVPYSELKNLKPGRLDIFISRKSKSPLQNSTAEGGEFIMNYVLKTRKTILKN